MAEIFVSYLSHGFNLIGLLIFLSVIYWIFFIPMNWTRGLTEVTYSFATKNIRGNDSLKRETINRIRRLRKTTLDKHIPPPYPNGWYAIAESNSIQPGRAISVSCLGEQFVVFRSQNMQIYVLDAYCPHMGANLGVGGTVINDTIQCPFHQWQFNGKSGECTNVPYSSCVPKSAKIKPWISKEANDFIFIWYNCDIEEIPWPLPIIDAIESKKFAYHGRNEFLVNCHIQDIPENGADLAHFSVMHSDSVAAGNNPQYKWLASLGHHNWNASWQPEIERKYAAKIFLQHSMRFFSKYDICSMDVNGSQVGPSYVILNMNTTFGPVVVLQTVTPVQPLIQKVIHRFYASRLAAGYIKFLIFAESIMFERDMLVWNHKAFVNSPCLVKEDRAIKLYRNWFSQFYSENSKSFEQSNESLEW